VTPGVNFTNDLCAAFMWAYPESAKKSENLTAFFALSGSVRAKAAHRTLMKLSAGRIFF